MTPWTIQPLDPSHEVASFDCGEVSLNSFLQKHALANDRAGLGRTFVAVESGQKPVVGYFTISTGSVKFNEVPDHPKRRLPKYPIPTVHIGRLAVDAKWQGKRLGAALLVESLRKPAKASTSVGVYAVDLVALTERAKRFYLKYGFIEMLDDPFHLFLPIQTARAVAGIVEG
jgi:ribosomal protein S18 acetylase RimI-like enzyme